MNHVKWIQTWSCACLCSVTPQGHGHNEVNLESFAQPLNSTDSGMKDKMLTPLGPDKSEESPTKSMGSIIIDPEETNCGATTEDLFSNASLRGLSKRSHILDGAVSNDTDNEGVNQQVKRYHSLAIG